MQIKHRTEEDLAYLEDKQAAINGMKEKFNKMIMNKLGELLLDGMSEYLGIEYHDQDQIKVLKLPQFLKPLFGYFKDNQLLVETSLLYLIHSLNLMNPEMQTRYDINISKIEQKKYDIMEFKDLLWINLDISLDYVCKFRVPALLVPVFPHLENEAPNLIALALLKIFEWLDLLNSKVSELIPRYQQSFNEIYHAIKNKLSK